MPLNPRGPFLIRALLGDGTVLSPQELNVRWTAGSAVFDLKPGGAQPINENGDYGPFFRIEVYQSYDWQPTTDPFLVFDTLSVSQGITLQPDHTALTWISGIRCLIGPPEDRIPFIGYFTVTLQDLLVGLALAYTTPDPRPILDLTKDTVSAGSLSHPTHIPFLEGIGFEGWDSQTNPNLALRFQGHGDPQTPPFALTFQRFLRPQAGTSTLGPFRATVGVSVPDDQFSVLSLRQSDDTFHRWAAPLSQLSWHVELSYAFPLISLLSAWNDAVAIPYLKALQTVDRGMPLSLMPWWREDADNSSWGSLLLELVDADIRSPSPTSTEFSFVADGQAVPAGSIGIQDSRLQPAANATRGLLPGFLRHEGIPFGWSTSISSIAYNPRAVAKNASTKVPQLVSFGTERVARAWILKDAGADNQFDGTILWTVVGLQSPSSFQQVRIGALDLTLPYEAVPVSASPPPPSPSTLADSLSSRLSVRFSAFEPVLGGSAQVPVIELTIWLSATSIVPGGQDDVRGEDIAGAILQHTEAPVVIPLSEPPDGQFLLSVGETTEDQLATGNPASQSLTITIIDTSNGQVPPGQTQPVIVVDRQPLLIARVEAPVIRGVLSADGDKEVGTWSNVNPEGAGWSLRGADEGFALYLPPQTVGEAMERGRDLAQNESIDFRFSPPARCLLYPSYFTQTYVEAAWNLRRILGYVGQRSPGAGVQQLDFELLYGLACSVTYPYLRLAEMESRLGNPPGLLPDVLPWATKAIKAQTDAYGDLVKSWRATFGSYITRLAVLEPQDADQPNGLVLQDQGIAFQLRASASLQYPIRAADGSAVSPPTGDNAPPNDPNGLAGGIAWAFESANIYQAVWRNPNSTSAKLANPAFSALGGWGFQKASFDKDRSTIYANTSMGRVTSYSLERIGRIGVLWNLAKHVVVYERTVLPSEQFQSQQDAFEGIPILRKVREYVEILQPQRAYPEFGAAPITRGFVLSSEFKSRVINVDSAWGGDVRDVGWQVPLWLRDSIDPIVYPKPQIVLEVATDPNGGTSSQLVAIDEPEKLVFYTSTTSDTDAQTDNWPSVRDIDYTDLPRPRPPAVAAMASTIPDQSLPDPPAIEPGYGKFTWAVASSSRYTNLVAERTSGALGALLRNVTMCRAASTGNGQPSVVNNPQIQPLIATLPTIGDSVGQLLTVVQSELLPSSGQVVASVYAQKIQPFLQDANGPAAAIINDLTTVDSAIKQYAAEFDPQSACQLLQATADQTISAWVGATTQLLSQFVNVQLASVRNLLQPVAANYPNDLKRRAGELADSLINNLKSTAEPIRTGLEDLQRVLGAAANAASGFASQIDASLDDLGRIALAQVGQADDLFLQELGQARSALRASLSDLASRIEATLQGDLGALSSTLQALVGTLEGAIDDAFSAIEGLIASGAQAVKDYLDHTAKPALDAAAKAISDEIAKAIAAAGGAAGSEFTVLLQALSNWDTDWKDDEGKVHLGLNKVLHNAIDALPDVPSLDQVVIAFQAGGTTFLSSDRVSALVALISPQVHALTGALCSQFGSGLQALWQAGYAGIKDLLAGSPIQNLVNSLAAAGADYDQLRQALDNLRNSVTRQVGPIVEGVAQRIGSLLPPDVWQVGNSTLQLIRAFGDAPVVQALDFNRNRLAYFFDEAQKAVDITPAAALVNRVGDQLKGLGIRVPAKQLLDRVLPDSLQNFDLSKIFPDFAGLKLDSLFGGLQLPDLANDAVKVTHGVDKQTMRAWLQADVGLPIAGPATLFCFGPVALELNQAQFTASARIEAGVSGTATQRVQGQITGDWELHVGGLHVVTFRETSLSFDESGHFRFALSPGNVDLQGALKFISDLMSSLGLSGKGFSVHLVQRNGLPVGVTSVLDLPLPDLSFGVFGISNLRLSGTFDLLAQIGAGGLDFSLATSLAIGRKTQPFTLTIFILGGGGWLETSATYHPLSGSISTAVTIGIVVGAGLEFALGPIRGGVWVQFGVSAEFEAATNSGDLLTVTVLFLLRGEVQALGFISVSLRLMLEAQYQSDGSLKGHGELDLDIKICWFFTFSFHTAVDYTFAKGSQDHRALGVRFEAFALASGDFNQAATNYISMLE